MPSILLTENYFINTFKSKNIFKEIPRKMCCKNIFFFLKDMPTVHDNSHLRQCPLERIPSVEPSWSPVYVLGIHVLTNFTNTELNKNGEIKLLHNT